MTTTVIAIRTMIATATATSRFALEDAPATSAGAFALRRNQLQ